MADNALAALSSATALDGSELYYVVQGGSDRKTTGTTIVTLVQAQNLGTFSTTTSAQLLAKISDKTGTGSVVAANAPTLVAPVLGNAQATTLNIASSVYVGSNGGATAKIVLFGSSTGLTALTVASNVTGSVTFVLPTAYGGTGSVLQSDSVGNWSFAAKTSGGDMVAANNLSDVASTVTARSNLGVAIGTNVQAFDSTLHAALPVGSHSANYTATATDANGVLYHPTADTNNRTFTIPSNASVAYTLGTTLTFINDTSVVSIPIDSDTLVAAGTGSTGTRSLAAFGMVTAVKKTSTIWQISGIGLT